MITNFELIDEARKRHIDLVGIFSKDQLPYQRKDGGYIVNLQDDRDASGNYNEGSHWVCFYIKKKQAVYMDPFGIVPPRNIQEFLSPYRPFPYNQKQIQDIKSQFCGWYCLYFLQWFQRQTRIKSFANRLNIFTEKFNKNPRYNESFLKTQINIPHHYFQKKAVEG